MEREPHHPDEQEPQRPVPDEDGREPADAERSPQAITIEFGQLGFIPPVGESWPEWVIARGIVDSEREDRAIDHRTAYYIAKFLREPSTPALRKLASTGSVDLVALQEETISLYADQTEQVQSWMQCLAHYCLSRTDSGPVQDWRVDIEQQDRVEAEWLRREQVMGLAENFFESIPASQVKDAGERDMFAAVRYFDSFGGLILHRHANGDREVWATDSEIELGERWTEILAQAGEAPQSGWLLRMPPGHGDGGERPESSGGQPAPPGA